MGLILPQSVVVCFVGKQKLFLESKGYNTVSYKSLVKINVLDLLSKSTVIVKAICDYCGNEYETPYRNIIALQNSTVQKASCKDCKYKKCQEQKRMQTLKSSKINPLYWDKTWLKQQYITHNLSAKEIGQTCGVSARRIMRYTEKFGLSKLQNPMKILTKEFLEEEYIDNLKTITQISVENGFSFSTVKDMLIQHNIHIYTRGEYMEIYYNLKGGREVRSIDAKRVWGSGAFREKHLIATRNAFTHAVRKKISIKMQGIEESDWKDFITNNNIAERCSCYYKDWRTAVFERDHYTCQCCGARNGNGIGIVLQAHHIKNFSSNKELRLSIDNGITMCKHCHSPQYKGSFHSIYGNINNNKNQLDEYISQYKTREHART